MIEELYITLKNIPKENQKKATHHVLVKIKDVNPKNEKVLVEVSNKVYEVKNGIADVVITLPQNNELQNRGNAPDIEIKAFLYNVDLDKITHAKAQIFINVNPLKSEFVKVDDIKTTSKLILSDWSQFRVVKTGTVIGKNNIAVKQKIKVHFTVGMFFDGTGNNKSNSEKVYYEKLNNDRLVYSHIPKEKELPNGKKIDSESSYWNPYSNIVLLHDLYETTKNDKDENNIFITLKQYIQGIGTIENEEDDPKGFALGEGISGIKGKVIEGCHELSKNIKKILSNDKEIGSITFDIFGFSRGAAAARDFCNEILGKKSITDIFEILDKENTSKHIENTSVKQQNAIMPIGYKYNLGLLGQSLKLNKTQDNIKYYFEKPRAVKSSNVEDLLKIAKKTETERLEKSPVKIRFVGLFDTVVSQMIVKDHLGKKIDLFNLLMPSPLKLPPGIGSATELALNIVKQKIDNLPIQQIVHFIAEDEWRENFALTKVGNKKNIFEVKLPGAHSDIGGGYAAIKEDYDIIAYEQTIIDAGHQRLVPPNLHNLRNFFIRNELGTNKDFYFKINVRKQRKDQTNYDMIEVIDWQLVAKRKVTPRYSVVNMYAMKELAQLSNVPFKNDKPNYKYSFEYDTPKELVKYQKELIEKLKLELHRKKAKQIKNKLSKIKFIHLSANYNLAKLIERKGEPIFDIKKIDKLLYINSPRYANENKDSYLRETYIHPQ
ncbi:phospholipase effector Tle1 domain-containing protein [Flavobacterium limnosediminis]|nr:DUF2235 domain-containing protein [Flavobacterium limnosediminis]